MAEVSEEIRKNIEAVCRKAKEHASAVAFASEADMNAMLRAAADALRAKAAYIIAENAEDVKNCTRGAQFADRLMLNEKRIDGIAAGLEKLVELKCPVGEVLEERTLYNGLQLSRVRVPLGVIGIIYESRPNVTADAIGLCVKSGNAVVLRGSKDALRSNKAICAVVKGAIAEAGYDPEFIQLIEDGSREGATALMQMNGLVDVLIPAGVRRSFRTPCGTRPSPLSKRARGIATSILKRRVTFLWGCLFSSMRRRSARLCATPAKVCSWTKSLRKSTSARSSTRCKRRAWRSSPAKSAAR